MVEVSEHDNLLHFVLFELDYLTSYPLDSKLQKYDASLCIFEELTLLLSWLTLFYYH